jgi:hypothetical protein
VRFPEGITGESFFQKHWDKGRPEYVETVTIFSSSNDKSKDWILCNNLPTLLWLGQVAALEIHPWYSRTSLEPDAHELGTDFGTSEETLDASALNYPDFVVFDLDPVLKNVETPYDLDAYKRTAEVAMALKDVLDALKLRSYVKTSGKTGLHVYVPVFRIYTYNESRAIAETGEQAAHLQDLLRPQSERQGQDPCERLLASTRAGRSRVFPAEVGRSARIPRPRVQHLHGPRHVGGEGRKVVGTPAGSPETGIFIALSNAPFEVPSQVCLPGFGFLAATCDWFQLQ